MALSIVNWNIAENIVWYVRLENTGSAISVALYLSEADAEAETNAQAIGVSSAYGASLEITLNNASEATTPVSLFRDDYGWHLIVSGASGDSDKIFKIKEFVDLDEISHAIYRNGALIEARASAEIDAHTHAAIIRDIMLATHLPTLEPGDIINLDSDRRDLDDMGQVFEHTITGTVNSLTDTIEMRKFLELKR